MEALAYSRIQEPLSRGEDFKKLLKLHISPYLAQKEYVEKLENLKSVEYCEGAFLEWLGAIKGVKRPFTVVGSTSMQDFYAWSFDGEIPQNQALLTFVGTQSEPFFFDNKIKYYKVSDVKYKQIVRAYCMLTNFAGTVEEYELFYETIFNLEVKVRYRREDYNLEFTVTESKSKFVDRVHIRELTPTLPQVKNYFLESPYSQISYAFNNMDGIGWNFDGLEQRRSFTFDFKE
jgi:hypothetical protein